MFYIIVMLAGIFAMPASAQSVKDQLCGNMDDCILYQFHKPQPVCKA
jgi:hypothetical protein